MPIVRIEMLAGRSHACKQQIAQEVTDILVRRLGSDPAHVYVMFSDLAHDDWAVGGRFFPTPGAKQPENTDE